VDEGLDIFYFGENPVIAVIRRLLRGDFVRAGSYDDEYAPWLGSWSVMLLILLIKNRVTDAQAIAPCSANIVEDAFKVLLSHG
jgi:hypothetical protein